MRYRLGALMLLLLFVMLPVMYLAAAPAPEPAYAIYDIGLPPKGMTAEEFRKALIAELSLPHAWTMVWADSEVRKLASVTRLKDPRPWMAKSIRITEEGGGRRLRFTFRAGTRAEQVTILNTQIRECLDGMRGERIKFYEKKIRHYEKSILQLEKSIELGQQPEMVDSYRKSINDLRSIDIPAQNAEIDRLKQIAVIKWAK